MPKLRIDKPVMLLASGVEGDWQRNRKYHGGPDKAVLMLSAEVIDDLVEKRYPVEYGSLGENLTVFGLDPQMWRSGQRYQVGDQALIELTTLRQPCLNLDVYGRAIKNELYDKRCRAGDASSALWARGGFYARVIREGPIGPGDEIKTATPAEPSYSEPIGDPRP